MNELPLPEGAVDDPEAQEMARIWVTRSDLLVMLNVGSYPDEGRSGRETTAWGEILADTIKHLARAISLRYETSPVTAQEQILARCTEALAAYQKEFGGRLGGNLKS